jgi:hypothetical protein
MQLHADKKRSSLLLRSAKNWKESFAAKDSFFTWQGIQNDSQDYRKGFCMSYIRFIS